MRFYVRRHSIVKDDIHATVMDLCDGLSPGLDGTKVLVEQSRIKCRVAIRAPWLVHQNCTSEIDALSRISINSRLIGNGDVSP